MQVIRERLGLNALPLCTLPVSPVAQAPKGLQVPRSFRLPGPVPASWIVLAESPRRNADTKLPANVTLVEIEVALTWHKKRVYRKKNDAGVPDGASGMHKQG